MARNTKRTNKKPVKRTRNSVTRDLVQFVPGVSQLQLAERHLLPRQETVNRLVRGNPNDLQYNVVDADGRLVSSYPTLDKAKQIARDLNRQHHTGGYSVRYKRRNPEDIEFLNNNYAPELSHGHIGFTPEGLEEFTRDGYIYHAYAETPVFGDGYRMGTPIETLEQVAVENPAKYERCVRAVQLRGGANGYAVCAGLRNPRSRRRNPASESDTLYESFHGVPPSETLDIREDEHVHGNLAGLGQLTVIELKLTGGKNAGGKTTLTAPDPVNSPDEQIVHVASNEAGTQLYLVGGDQRVDVQKLGFRDSFDVKHDGETFEASELKDLMVLGEIQKLTYRTQKGFDNFESIDYYHRLGEDTKKRPYLLYDTMNQKMKIAGGEYHIHDVGVVN